MSFIPSWDILITIDFSTPKSLLTNLYEFRVESLHITMANLFSTLIASENGCQDAVNLRQLNLINIELSQRLFGIPFFIVPLLHLPHPCPT